MTIGKSQRSRNRTGKDAPITRRRADLLRQFFNFWANSGNLAKVIKRRFRDKLRTHNTQLVVLFKHITVFALEVARLRNKSILNSITPLSFYYCHLWQITAAGIEHTQEKTRTPDTAKMADIPTYVILHITKIALNSCADYHFTIFAAVNYTATAIT